jgi:hypothetical protein
MDTQPNAQQRRAHACNGLLQERPSLPVTTLVKPLPLVRFLAFKQETRRLGPSSHGHTRFCLVAIDSGAHFD